MSLFAPQNTLAFQTARPLCVQRDLRLVPFARLASQMSQVGKKLGQVHPEQNAVEFYLLQHAMGLIRSEFGMQDPLPAVPREVCETYHSTCNSIAVRMFYYLVQICMVEGRHLQV